MSLPLYQSATIVLPGRFSENEAYFHFHERDEEGGFKPFTAFDTSSVAFSRKGCLIIATRRDQFPHLPGEHKEYKEVIKETGKECMTEVIKDLSGFDDFEPKLLDLASCGTVQADIYYNQDGGSFSVADYSKEDHPTRTFNLAARLLNVAEEVIMPEFRVARSVAQYVKLSKSPTQTSLVKGGTLAEALERAITLYEFGERAKQMNWSSEK